MDADFYRRKFDANARDPWSLAAPIFKRIEQGKEPVEMKQVALVALAFLCRFMDAVERIDDNLNRIDDNLDDMASSADKMEMKL